MKFKINFEKAATTLVIIASLGSLYIVSYQTSLMSKQFELQRQEQYTSVFPYLAMGNTSNKDMYGFIISNNGIGPALVDEINIHYNDSVYKNYDLRAFFTRVIIKEDSIFSKRTDIGHSTVSPGKLIPQNKTIHMIQITGWEPKEVMALRKWFNKKIVTEIKYSSIYGEQWSIKYPSKNSIPKKIKNIKD